MEVHPIRRGLTGLGVLAAHPAAFGIVPVYAVLWFFLQRDTLDWHGVAALATWFMTLVIQRAVHRDNQALQAKLDELLRAQALANIADHDWCMTLLRRAAITAERFMRRSAGTVGTAAAKRIRSVTIRRGTDSGSVRPRCDVAMSFASGTRLKNGKQHATS